MTLVLDSGWAWTFVVKIIKGRHRLHITSVLDTPSVINEIPSSEIQKRTSKNIVYKNDAWPPNKTQVLFDVASDNTVIKLQHDKLKMHVQYVNTVVISLYSIYGLHFTQNSPIQSDVRCIIHHLLCSVVFKNSKGSHLFLSFNFWFFGL